MPDQDQSNEVVAPTRRPRRIGGMPILVVAAIFVAGLAVGLLLQANVLGGSDLTRTEALARIDELERANENAEERIWKLYREREALADQIATSSEDATQTAPRVPEEGAYADGVYVVGEDIEPGDYDGVVTGEFGYWARLNATDGTVGSILVNALPSGPFVLTVKPADRAIELRGVVLTPR